jgi:transcriptional regulator with XRE-family HTH domain
MADDKITVHGRELGAELRRRRQLAGYQGQELARRLGWSHSKLSRLETGSRLASEVDIAMYLVSIGVPRDEIDPLLDLAREALKDHHLTSHGEKLPDELKTLIFHEATAVAIESYELIAMPGLLQTEDYIRALLSYGKYKGDSLEFRVQARVDRQSLLKRSNPPDCLFFLHENAVRTRVGSNAVMHEQFLHLVFLTNWRHCSIRVVPRSADGLGLASTSFHRMSYLEHSPVVEIDLEASSLFLDRTDDTNSYGEVLNRLDRVALDEEQSRRLFADLANEFDRAEEDNRA